ncbi:hypothetical protein [Streptomyces sp. NPDC101455]|uniref:hypothetical protein n=1 Tax=Streptomyces sp. NPDC101455 TaxID=3366142 RepID=UPI00381B92D3
MTNSSTAVPAVALSPDWLARIAQSLKIGADRHGVTDADAAHEEMVAFHGPAEREGTAQVPVELAGRLLAALSTTRDHVTRDDWRRMITEEAEHVARLLLDGYEETGQLSQMLTDTCLRATARA